MSAPCQQWITAADIVNTRGADAVEGIDVAVLEKAAAAASDVLWALSGRQFTGPCRATIRPALLAEGWNVPDMVRMYGLMVGSVYLGAGTGWWGWGSCYGGDHLRCHDRHSVDLGVYPIGAVHSVIENGTIMPSGSYRVDNDRFLVRLDGGHWNMHQLLDHPTTDDATWAVDVTYGDPLPAAAASAAVSLALETGKAWSNLTTLLPQRVTQINRQGVQWTILDPMAFLEKGRTGVYDVDLFITTYNPNSTRTRPRVLSPDTARQTRRVGPITGG